MLSFILVLPSLLAEVAFSHMFLGEGVLSSIFCCHLETISLETSFIGVIFLFPCGNSSAFAGQKRGAVKVETSCSASSSSAQFLPSSSAAVHELKSVVGLCWHSCGKYGDVTTGAL